VVGALAALLVAGCSTGFQPLNRPALRMTNPRTVAAPRQPTPSFTSNTATVGAMFGLVGAALESSMDRSRLLAHSGPIRDPAGAIRASVVAALAKRFALAVVDPNAPRSDDDAPAAAPPAPPDLIVEIRTTAWGVVGASGGVGFTYDGILRLTDARTKRVLAEDTCTSHPVTGEPVSELASDGGAGLKDELKSVIDYCADEYRHRGLGLY
jgi:hypothetical protein